MDELRRYVRKYLDGGLAKDLWKAMQGSFMKELPDSMLDPLCQDEGWEHLKAEGFSASSTTS